MNQNDLKEFSKLCESPIRSEEREQALRSWEAYKLSRQAEVWGLSIKATRAKKKVPESTERLPETPIWTKSDYVTSLTAHAIDLRGATFADVCVGFVDLRGALLDEVTFDCEQMAWSSMKGAKLENARLRGARLQNLRLMKADLSIADLTDAKLQSADLSEANLSGADLSNANLSDANLERANLVGANVSGCCLDGARVYGAAVWDLHGEPSSSSDLIVTPEFQPTVTVDNIKVAQFLYLLLRNPEIRGVLDTITRKVVLILGRFTDERLSILKSLRSALRKHDFVPVLFDFDAPKSRDVEETVSTLAHMARFIIADISDPKAIPQELSSIVKNLQSVPVLPLMHDSQEPWGMFASISRRSTVLPILEYSSEDELISKIQSDVIEVSEAKAKELMP